MGQARLPPSAIRVLRLGGDGEMGNHANAGQRLAAEPLRADRLEILKRLQFRRRKPLAQDRHIVALFVCK